MSLTGKKCVPCEGGVAPLTPEQIAELQKELTLVWEVHNNEKISHFFRFKDFKESMIFVNKIAELAEAQGHHPDIHISYNRVTIELWTHAIHGLSENDFILAKKIETI